MDLRTAATQALEALDNLVDVEVYLREHVVSVAKNLRTALAEQPEPVAWTERELELLDGMIGAQLYHAAQCDNIQNRTMAERQKAWDMERVALLRFARAVEAAVLKANGMNGMGVSDE